jgi:membrane fusion protein (multidrug efflux system)
LIVNSTKAEIEIQKSLIRKTEILAPFDGVIGLKNVSIGDQINPSTLVGVIRTENKLKIDFNVPEKQVCQKESLFLKLPLLVFVQF